MNIKTVSHLAGPSITISGRVIQRCLICGYKLCDSLNCAMPMNTDGTMPRFATWEKGSFVQIEGNRSSIIPEEVEGKLPDDSCIDLVEF